MRNSGLPVMLVSLVAVLFCQPGESDAARYQLQVSSVPERVFMYFVRGQTLPLMESFLDDEGRSKFVLFRDRQPQPMDLQEITLPKRHDPWGAMIWDGEEGRVAVFRIYSERRDYQKLRRVAVLTNGMLTRFPVHGIPVASQGPIGVPATSASYLTKALRDGTFRDWAEQRAVSYDGLSIVVGRHQNAQQCDTVYLVVRMSQVERAYKVILGWENLEHGSGYAKDQGAVK